jgi:hypothetical protein
VGERGLSQGWGATIGELLTSIGMCHTECTFLGVWWRLVGCRGISWRKGGYRRSPPSSVHVSLVYGVLEPQGWRFLGLWCFSCGFPPSLRRRSRPVSLGQSGRVAHLQPAPSGQVAARFHKASVRAPRTTLAACGDPPGSGEPQLLWNSLVLVSPVLPFLNGGAHTQPARGLATCTPGSVWCGVRVRWACVGPVWITNGYLVVSFGSTNGWTRTARCATVVLGKHKGGGSTKPSPCGLR